MPKEVDKLLESIRTAASASPQAHLTYAIFRELTGIPMSQVQRHFDSWKEACATAGVTCGEASPGNITPRFSKGKDHALSEVKRIATLLGVSTLSKKLFDAQHPQVKACTVARLWGTWDNVLKAANLEKHPLHHVTIPLDELACEFLAVFRQLGRAPTVIQLTRRSKHAKNTFTRKFTRYNSFKKRAIAHLLSKGNLSEGESRALKQHLDELTSDTSEPARESAPHATGRHLGFRAFAHVPTYEAEVVSLFSCVADELGFEIVAQRPQFPDCEARQMTDKHRKRYRKCLIEFELRSSDYRKHKHPLDGCDLIVCWEHDWKDCPVDVLDLQSKIKRLDGWK